jgi:hypothetical protein
MEDGGGRGDLNRSYSKQSQMGFQQSKLGNFIAAFCEPKSMPGLKMMSNMTAS